MTTIIRVKRHRGEDPVEALVLSCKRKKTEDSLNPDSFKKILNFSGTVEEKDDNIATNTVNSFTKGSKYSKLIKNHVPEIISKERKVRKERSDYNRFTLLSCLRSKTTLDDVSGDEEDGGNVTIVDVSKENDEKSEHNTSHSSFVYDLYSTNFDSDSDFNDLYMENLLSVQPLEFELQYRNGEDCYEEIDPDEEDSNDENNWRNDYPDTESDVEEDEEGDILAKQLKGCHLGDGSYNLSDDSGEEEYLHYKDDENYHYYEAEDWGGRSYARYKANAMRFMIDDEKGKEDEDDDSADEYQDCEVLSYHENSD